jgi:hypothetical protein
MNRKTAVEVVVIALLLAIPSGSARAESITCGSSNPHPVCAASYAAHPSGVLRRGETSSGTAVVGGKKIKWTCVAGTSSSPRRCSW